MTMNTYYCKTLFVKMLITHKNSTWEIIACTDTTARPVQSYTNIELSYVAGPPLDLPGL
jgi:hypothetical protein